MMAIMDFAIASARRQAEIGYQPDGNPRIAKIHRRDRSDSLLGH